MQFIIFPILVFSGKGRRQLIKMSVLQTFRAVREGKGGQEYDPGL